MAETAYLRLSIDGNDVRGDCDTVGHEETIECHSFRSGLEVTVNDRDLRQPIVTKNHDTVRICKRIDSTTPLLIRAACEGQAVDRAEFMFYRPHPGGAGILEHFYTVVLEEGTIAGVKQISEDHYVGGEAAPPMMEEVLFTVKRITWTYVEGGIDYTDSAERP